MSALHRFTLTSVSLALGLGLGGLGGCQQPRSHCTTAHGKFAASYTL